MEGLISNYSLVNSHLVGISMNLSLAAAETLIDEYATSNPDKVAHIVCGKDSNNGLVFSLCNNKEKIDKEKNSLQEISGTFVYGSTINGDNASNNDNHVSKFSDLLDEARSADDAKILRVCGPITSTSLKIVASGAKVSRPMLKSTSKTTSATSSSTTSANTSKSGHAKISKSVASTITASKNSAKVKSFFAKSKSNSSSSGSSSSRKSPENEKENNSNKDKKEKEVSKSNNLSKSKPIIPVAMETEDGEDAEWDDGTGYKADKDKLKDRKTVAGAPVGTGGMAAPDLADSDDELFSDKKDKATDLTTLGDNDDPPSPFKVHGAMDDFFEDNKDKIPVKSPSQKRKKRKMVEKTSVDDQGFMVTDYVEEWVTDDESSPARKPATSSSALRNPSNTSSNAETQKQKPLPKPLPKPQSSAKKTKTGAKQTNTLMGFFGKK